MVLTLCLWALTVCLTFVHGQLDGNSDCPVSPDHFEEKEPQQAVIGADVVLPCFPKFRINVNDDILEWSKGNDEIYVIRKKLTIINNGRLSVSIEEVEKGNASLYLSGVKQSDEGRFCCCIRMNGKPTCTNVTLAVKEEDEETSTEHPGNLQISPTEAPTNSTGRDRRGMIAAVVFFIFLILGGGGTLLFKHKCQQQEFQDSKQQLLQDQLDSVTVKKTSS